MAAVVGEKSRGVCLDQGKMLLSFVVGKQSLKN